MHTMQLRGHGLTVRSASGVPRRVRGRRIFADELMGTMARATTMHVCLAASPRGGGT